MVNTLIPPTGDNDVVRGNQKKLRIMKKEYQKPITFAVPIATAAGLMSGSPVEVNPNPGGTDDFGVKEENTTTNGGSIWDKEW